MAEADTRPAGDAATAAIEALEDEGKRADARALDALFRRVTGREPVLWPGSILGYGRYAYTYDSGRTGESLATGFSPRKAEFSIYIMPGGGAHGAILGRLGKHRMGKACLYVKRLSDIDIGVLEELVRAGLADLSARWPVTD